METQNFMNQNQNSKDDNNSYSNSNEFEAAINNFINKVDK